MAKLTIEIDRHGSGKLEWSYEDDKDPVDGYIKGFGGGEIDLKPEDPLDPNQSLVNAGGDIAYGLISILPADVCVGIAVALMSLWTDRR